MLLHEVVAASEAVAATRSRLAKTGILAELLRRAGPQAPLAASYLSGTLPQGRIGVGWLSLRPAPPAAAPTLTLTQIDAAFTRLAGLAGVGSGVARTQVLEALWSAATAGEQRLLTGLLTGNVRQGAGEGVMLAAIAGAAGIDERSVRRAHQLCGRIDEVTRIALTEGAPGIGRVGLVIGRPVHPMLAASAPTVSQAVTQAGTQAGTGPAAGLPTPVRVECKLDGIRIQAHRDGDDVRVFTRGLDDITGRVPEVARIVRALPARRLVVDGEAIALTPAGRPLPFQETGARVGRHAGPDAGTGVALSTFLFDLLHLDGQDLLDEPLAYRVGVLDTLVPAAARVPSLVTADADAAQRQSDEWVAAGHEGVVVKDLQAPYAIGRRGGSWIKVKPRRTLDLVVLAAEWGSGRRRGWLSNIHLGARDGAGGFVMVGKTFKGMTDDMLRWQTRRFQELARADEGHVVWLRPEQVVEVALDGVQRSGRYPGGVSLRFARVVRYRDDKATGAADTIDTVRAMAGPADVTG